MTYILDQFASSTSATPFPVAVGLLISLLAFIVSLLTLYNAARLRQGTVAVSSLAFGTGMLSVSAGILLLSFPVGISTGSLSFAYQPFFAFGFLCLGFGSLKIYQMSRIR